jgi:very-short-patch-repair endonuclease
MFKSKDTIKASKKRFKSRKNKKKIEDKSVKFTVNEILNFIELINSKEYIDLKNRLNRKISKIVRSLKVVKLEKKYAKDGLTLEERAYNFREELVKKQTEAEKILKIILSDANIEYEFQKIIFYNKTITTRSFFIVDFYLPEYKLDIEVDGKYHNDIAQVKLDKQRRKALQKDGIMTLRLTNESILTNKDYILDRLKGRMLEIKDKGEYLNVLGTIYKKRKIKVV